MEHAQYVLRLEPEAAPVLRTHFRDAIDQVGVALTELNRNGYLVTPWLGDEVSSAVAAHYTRRAMEEPGSSYQLLLAYRDELIRIHDSLRRMEDEYRRADHKASIDIRRRA
jgi:hypothetical protein